PVASTMIAPGRPRAKHSYHSNTSRVTNPSSLARHGTIAGTQVRCSREIGPTWMGEKSLAAAASAALGQRPPRGSWRIRSGGRHIRYHSGRFNFDLSLRLHQSDDLHDAHHRKVLAHHIAI